MESAARFSAKSGEEFLLRTGAERDEIEEFDVSRIGNKKILITSGVKLTPTKQEAGTRIEVEGPKGKLAFDFRPEVSFDVKENEVEVKRAGETAFERSYHGTARALLANMVHGVSKGFEKQLEIIGVGYNAKLQGKELRLQIGFCHPVDIPLPAGVEVETPSPTRIVIRGADKQVVGEFAARVRRVRPPEPYKGKGIRYDGEQVIRKAGKTFGSGE